MRIIAELSGNIAGGIVNWDDLRLFLAVSRTQKLDRAGAKLRLDATTLSRRLRRLEIDLGQTLFERTRRGHILTHAGEQLVQKVEAIESLSFSIDRPTESGDAISGKIRLGVTEGFGAKIIAPALSEFCTQWPEIEVELIALSGFVSVPKREADMAILLTRPKTGRLKVRKLADYTLHLYASRAYLAQFPPVRTVEALSEHRLIGYVDDLIYSPQLRYFDEVLPGLRPHLCSPSILAQLEMTRAGAGFCILPRFLAAEHSELCPILINEITVSRSFWLTTHEDVCNFARVKVFSDFLTGLISSSRVRMGQVS